MDKLGLNEIRKLFLEFFASKDHLVVPSYSLVPVKDKSLLLISAGMAPLKPYFVGTEEPPYKRMATCQKCIRTGDIENVGMTARHATFFEMLGNFSFGDYFKEGSIELGWEFITKDLKMPLDKLWVSVYLDDDEAFEIWNKKIGISNDRIVRLGKEDNFWEIGTGPCGPCSEIFYDRGEKFGCDNPDCKPGCECDRYVEFWNHVFTQFDKDENGVYHDLPSPNIDTGMGLERVACIMQDVNSIFEIDTMKSILTEVCETLNVKYGKNNDKDISIRIITDHVRAITFMISDGIVPSNEGRGYVLRKLLRRAARHGKLLGKNDVFLYKFIDSVISMFGESYPVLREKKDYIKKIFLVEEERFLETLGQGLEILKKYILEIEKKKEKNISGELAFKLYDTYGFPLDLSKEIAAEKGLLIDENGFEKEMDKQRERARKARLNGDVIGWKEDAFSRVDKTITSKFRGYDCNETDSVVLAVITNNDDDDMETEEVVIILDKTPFYAESGGQVGDTGVIFNKNMKIIVLDTKKGANDRIHHIARIKRGQLKAGDMVKAKIDSNRRQEIIKNHTATHILHKALKEVLGEHVTQAGSLVTSKRLRFDFTHFEGLTRDQLNEIENKANEEILKSLDVSISKTSMKEAEQLGAEALFGEKYGETVRIVKVGDYSVELCGGCHVKNSSELNMFLIESESGIAAGVRRIEAITGKEAHRYLKEKRDTLEKIAKIVKTREHLVVKRVEALMIELKENEKEISRLNSQLASGVTGTILENALEINNIKVIVKKIEASKIDDLRKMADILKEKIATGVVLLAAEINGKASFVAGVSKDLVQKGLHAGNLVKEVAKTTGGGGGGRPDMAQAGGKYPEKINEALESVLKTIEEKATNASE
ncbi:MAG: alanine--tRNA ligase [Clostridiales bacterium]|nr:alanine--tRNA ligase [Clostridiales bacterium]